MGLFYRSVDQSVKDSIENFKSLGRIRPTAYAKVTGKGYNGNGPNVTLPYKNTVYEDFRPKPSLQGIEISLEGDAGSLRRSSAKFKCYTLAQFDELHEAMLKPGCHVTLECGYASPNPPVDPLTVDAVVYDFSFKINRDNSVDCEFKAVGQGTPMESTSLSGGTSTFAVSKQNLQFVTNYAFFNESKPVQSIIDYADYVCQNALAPGASGFSPAHGSGFQSEGMEAGFSIVLPDGYKYPSSVINTGTFNEQRTNYFTFGFLIEVINKWCENATKKTIIEFNTESPITSLSNDSGTIKLKSIDPMSVVWLHPKGSAVGNAQVNDNNYGGMDTEPTSVLRFDDVTNIAGLQIASGFENILFCREFLREIESESSKTVEKNQPPQLLVRDFIEKLLARIKSASCGIYDLSLVADPDAENNPAIGKLLIVNKREVSADTVTPLVFDVLQAGGDGITRDLSLTGKVPKDIQSDAFTKGTGTTIESNDANALAAIDEQTVESPPAPNLSAALLAADKKAYTDDFNPEAFSGYKELYGQFIASQDASKQVKTNKIAAIYPLEMNITLNGIKGFKFGDLVTAKNLPAIYRNAAGGLRLAFTVTRITHTVDNNDWKTSLTTTCRLQPE